MIPLWAMLAVVFVCPVVLTLIAVYEVSYNKLWSQY